MKTYTPYNWVLVEVTRYDSKSVRVLCDSPDFGWRRSTSIYKVEDDGQTLTFTTRNSIYICDRERYGMNKTLLDVLERFKFLENATLLDGVYVPNI